jgi:uncharacterized membrane protein YdjX (TVP38/TMEM64 family)
MKPMQTFTRRSGRDGVHHAVVYHRAAIVVVLCAVLAALASSDILHGALLEVLAAVQRLIERHAVLGAASFVLLAAFSAMFTFLSVAVIVPAAVFAWGTPMSIGLLWCGWILGGMATYAIGKWLGRPVVRWLLAGNGLSRLESHLPADAPLWTVVLLQLALLSEIPGYLLGLVRYPFTRYALALGLAELPYTIATVYLGVSFVEGRSGLILLVGVVIAFFSLLMFHALRRALPSMGTAAHAGSRDEAGRASTP